MTINELQNEVVEEFSVFDDWMDKYQIESSYLQIGSYQQLTL